VRTFKSGFLAIGALMAVLYCAILFYYFLDISGSLRGAKTVGPGTILFGLSLVVLLLCIPFAGRIAGIFARLPSLGAGPDAPEAGDGFDADAAIARYMADRPAQGAAKAAPAPRRGGGPARRASFGRRTG